MKRTLLIIAAIATGITAHAEYIIAYKDDGVPAWAPADVQAFDYRDFHGLTPELQGYNPPFYPAAILRNTRIMSVQPDSWSNAITDINAQLSAMKSDKLKAAENKFFDLCFAIYGDRTKRGFDELNTAIEALTATDQNAATALAIRLLAVDAECKREGGNQWWDTAAYHEEIVP